MAKIIFVKFFKVSVGKLRLPYRLAASHWLRLCLLTMVLFKGLGPRRRSHAWCHLR